MVTRATIKTIEKHWNPESDEYKGNISSRNYILELAARTQTNIKRWNVAKVFAADDDGNLIHNFNEINKRFFNKMAAGADEDDIAIPEVPAGVKDKLAEFVKRCQEQEVNRLTREAERAERNMNGYADSLRRSNQNFMAVLHKLYIAQNKTTDERAKKVEAELEEILLQGFWSNLLVQDNGVFWLTTEDDVVMSERRRAAGIDRTVNLGRMAVTINLTHSSLKVVPYKNNLRPHGHSSERLSFFHPYISADGEVCWGGSQRVICRHMAEWNVKDILNMLQTLLTTYRADSQPYMQLEYFDRNTYKNVRAYGRRSRELQNPYNS